MSSFTRAGVAVLAVLAVHALASGFNWYVSWSWFDMLMHFSGGVAVALLVVAVWERYVAKIIFQKPLSRFWQDTVAMVLILGLVAFVGIVWEWYEFVFDRIALVAYPYLPPAQTSLGDTMADLALDLLGGFMTLILMRFQGRS